MLLSQSQQTCHRVVGSCGTLDGGLILCCVCFQITTLDGIKVVFENHCQVDVKMVKLKQCITMNVPTMDMADNVSFLWVPAHGSKLLQRTWLAWLSLEHG